MVKTLFPFLLFPLLLPAQIPDTLIQDTAFLIYHSAFKTVIIRNVHLERTGYAAWRTDTLPRGGALSLAERLLWENPLSVRATAPGALATLSARGMGPSHTPVFWNGINLQNPQHGQVDAALLPLWPDDRVEVRYGGQSAALSSGAMGGSVLVESAVGKDTGFWTDLGGALGSFGHYEGMAATGYGSEQFSTQVRAAWRQADNDFPFEKTALNGKPVTVRQTNNFQQNLDVQHFARLALSRGQVLKTSLWQQNAYRQIPPPLTATVVSETWQRDRSLRAVASWESAPKAKGQWLHRAAWLDERIRFHLNGDTDSSRARTFLMATEYTALVSEHWRWQAGASAQRQQGRADGYADTTRWYGQSRLAGHALIERRGARSRLVALLRQEWAEGQGAPFTWSLGGQVGGEKTGLLRFHVSRNFLLPTFNDRYWLAWGKPDLKPEKGYSADLGGIWIPRPGFRAEATVYSIHIDNWILWQPDDAGIYRPENARRVWSRGFEGNGNWKLEIGNWKYGVRVGYQYCRATNVAVYGGDEKALDKQLVYVPEHAGSLSLRAARGAFSAAYLHQFNGRRYATADNAKTGRLPGFQTGSLLARYEFNWRKTRLGIDAQLENCWNAAYQIIAYRPLPGRAWRVGISVKG